MAEIKFFAGGYNKAYLRRRCSFSRRKVPLSIFFFSFFVFFVSLQLQGQGQEILSGGLSVYHLFAVAGVVPLVLTV